MTKTKFYPVWMILSFVLLANAQQNLTREQIITDSMSGYSFTVPKDWSSKTGEGGYVLLNKSENANIVIKSHAYKDFDSFAKAEINPEKEGLKQVGEIQNLTGGGKAIRVYKPGAEKNLIIDTFFLVSSYGGGVIIASVSTDNTVAENSFKIANQIAGSVKFSKPPISAQSSEIQSRFAGKKLSYYYTGNGYSESTIIWLCPSGNFLAKNESSSTSAIGSGATSDSDQGTWKMQANGNSIFLILQGQKSGTVQLAVTPRQANNEIGLNNKRFFVQAHNECP